jgi:sec-independent protein translocase protein TatA
MEMNIAGAEWFVIAFVFIILFFGSKNLPSFSRTIGKAMTEYQKARSGISPLSGPKFLPSLLSEKSLK